MTKVDRHQARDAGELLFKIRERVHKGGERVHGILRGWDEVTLESEGGGTGGGDGHCVFQESFVGGKRIWLDKKGRRVERANL